MKLALVLVLCLAAGACDRGERAHISVGAAAVTRHAMPELVARYRELTGNQVDVTYGASDKLATRAGGDAPLDVLVLAEPGAFAGTNAGPPHNVATSSLVLVGPDRSALRFANLREGGVIAIGDPAFVPAGRYARSYLESLGIWDAVAPRLVFGGDVAGVLALAQRGTADVAIVYATDLADAPPLTQLDTAISGPVVQVAAAVTVRSAHRAEAQRFVTFLTSADARAILVRHRFEVVR